MKVLKTNIIFIIIGLIAIAIILGEIFLLPGEEEVTKIDIGKTLEVEKDTSVEEETIKIAVGSMITPKEGYAYYRQVLDYIGEKLGKRAEFIERETYAEINALIKSREVDMAFVCSKPYVNGHNDFGMELLLAPQLYGKTTYNSYILVHIESPIGKLEELRGKIFAFSDPLSNTGKLVPTYMLAKLGETPDSFFKSYMYTKAHDNTIKAVAQKVADGGAVDSLIWDYLDRTNTQYTSLTKIITTSEPYGIPPVVVHPDLDPKLKEKFKEILLNMDKDPKGKAILDKMMFDKFVPIEDNKYDTVRKMEEFIAKHEEQLKKPF
jgi:phosphonate transport system substrate-binding protein